MAGDRPSRFKSQSVRYRSTALSEARDGNWDRVEELLWGSAIAAVKAVALARGERLVDESDVRKYAFRVAEEVGDRSFGEILTDVGRVSPTLLQVQDSTVRWDDLYHLVKRICLGVERLLRLVPGEEEEHVGTKPVR